MNDAQFDQALKMQIDTLPKELAPERDLWAGIDHAIERQQSSQRFNFTKLTAVAAGVMVIGLTSWLTFKNVDLPSVRTTGQNLQYVNWMTESFEQQKQTLLVKYEDTPAMTDNWQEQLKQLDDAAKAIKKALAQDPSNAQLIKMLQQTYQQQLDLINAVNQDPWQMI